MKDWKSRNGLYEITEITRKGISKFTMIATGDQITSKLNGLNEMNGYVPGLGGDKSYSATAILLTYID